MREGILDSFAKDAGLKLSDSKDTPDFTKGDDLAGNIAGVMMESSIIKDFRSLSNHIYETYLDDGLVGPTGRKFTYSSGEDFMKAYPNWLQCYEFYILSQATIQTIKYHPEVRVIGHFHDGNVLLIPKAQRDKIVNTYTSEVKKLGKDLNLSYPMGLEIKHEWNDGKQMTPE